MDLHEEKDSLCDTKVLETEWSTSQSKKTNNIRKRYLNNASKNKQYKIIDMGVFCLINDITPDLLRVFVENGKRILDIISSDNKKADTSKNKVVVMSEEDYKAYEEYKRFKAFTEEKR